MIEEIKEVKLSLLTGIAFGIPFMLLVLLAVVSVLISWPKQQPQEIRVIHEYMEKPTEQPAYPIPWDAMTPVDPVTRLPLHNNRKKE